MVRTGEILLETYSTILTCSIIIPVFDLAFTLDLFILYY